MDLGRTSAFLLIAGFVAMILGFLVGHGNIYQKADLSERERIIEGNQTRWYVGQTLTGLGVVLITIGFVVLSIKLRAVGKGWIPTLGAVAIAIVTISGTSFLLRQTTDPIGAFSGQYPGIGLLYNFLTLAGLLLFGIAFLQAGLPTWLGYLTGGISLLYGVVFLVTGSGFPTPGVETLLSLLIAIGLLWQKPLP